MYLHVLGSSLFTSLHCFRSILPITISLHPVEPPIHIVVLEVCASVWALVLLARVVIEIYSLVVDEIYSSIVLLLILLLALILLRCSVKKKFD